MEVQEEEELEVMKAQRAQYEQVRNSQLVVAQRMEAKELRLK
jgi:hypothetical protein